MPIQKPFPDASTDMRGAVVSILAVDGSNDRIVCIKGRLHNIPSLIPYSLRYLVGWSLGSMAVLLEPLVLEMTRYLGMGPPVHESLSNESQDSQAVSTATTPRPATTTTKPSAQAPASPHHGNGNALPRVGGASLKMQNMQSPVPRQSTPLAPPQVY